ncbi:hypothetical protein J6590_050322 [Homalodisca vitripennis]|nr:hypothetical protein J6590_050322 [Homalodisca vitripennis]
MASVEINWFVCRYQSKMCNLQGGEEGVIGKDAVQGMYWREVYRAERLHTLPSVYCLAWLSRSFLWRRRNWRVIKTREMSEVDEELALKQYGGGHGTTAGKLTADCSPASCGRGQHGGGTVTAFNESEDRPGTMNPLVTDKNRVKFGGIPSCDGVDHQAEDVRVWRLSLDLAPFVWSRPISRGPVAARLTLAQTLPLVHVPCVRSSLY